MTSRSASEANTAEHAGMPQWVKALAVLGVLLVALVVVLHLTGNVPGGHAP
jgi:hypothetical protein